MGKKLLVILYLRCGETGDEEQFVMDMVDAIEKRIENDSDAYYIVTGVLRRTSSMEYLAEMLDKSRKAYQENKKSQLPANAGREHQSIKIVTEKFDKFRCTPDASIIDDNHTMVPGFTQPGEPSSKQIIEEKKLTDSANHQLVSTTISSDKEQHPSDQCVHSTTKTNAEEKKIDQHKHQPFMTSPTNFSDGSDAYQSAESSPKPFTKPDHKHQRNCCKKVEKRLSITIQQKSEHICDLETKLEQAEKNINDLQNRIKKYQQEEERLTKQLECEKNKVELLQKELDTESYEKTEERRENKIFEQELEQKVKDEQKRAKDERAKKEKLREEKEAERKLRIKHELNVIGAKVHMEELEPQSAGECLVGQETDDSRDCNSSVRHQPPQLQYPLPFKSPMYMYPTSLSDGACMDKPVEETS